MLVVGEIKGTLERATIGTEEGALTLVAREIRRARSRRAASCSTLAASRKTIRG